MAPEKLYKYVGDIGALKPLLAGSLKFALKSELNDPSEFIPEVDSDALSSSLSQLRQVGHTNEQFEWLCAQAELMKELCPEFMRASPPTTIDEANSLIHISFYDDFKKLSDLLFRMANTISQRAGVQCLSANWKSLPMWAHYSNNGQGFLVEYHNLHQHFIGDSTKLLNGVYPVGYSREQQYITFDPVSYKNLFFSKFSDWQYEREWRIVCPLASCETMQSPTSKTHIRYIPKHLVTSIIIGWSMKDRDIETVLKETGNTLSVFKAEFGPHGVRKSRIK